MVSVDEPDYTVNVDPDQIALSQIKLKYGWNDDTEQTTTTVKLVLRGTAVKVASLRSELFKWLMGKCVGVTVEMPTARKETPDIEPVMPGEQGVSR